jgi:hypothetical protein
MGNLIPHCVPREPIFEKSYLREKGGVLMLFKTTRHLGAKAQYTRVVPGYLNLGLQDRLEDI